MLKRLNELEQEIPKTPRRSSHTLDMSAASIPADQIPADVQQLPDFVDDPETDFSERSKYVCVPSVLPSRCVVRVFVCVCVRERVWVCGNVSECVRERECVCLVCVCVMVCVLLSIIFSVVPSSCLLTQQTCGLAPGVPV
jgi:hypothetical protein